ncbi:MAG: RloB domain-containing protein [Chitinophagales bacterium]|nr:RloB domain-containing protein [Chitinophagales bacterium]
MRLFVIVAEGEREDEYFSWFDKRNSRIQVQIVPREGHASAPNHFIKRLENFVDASQIGINGMDSVWFVLDVDRWSREAINDLISYAESATFSCNVAISNPCFEVWLVYHYQTFPVDIALNCAELKTFLGTLVRGGFRPDITCPDIHNAIRNASLQDKEARMHQYPDLLRTKVYFLAQELLEVLGNNWR